MRNGTSVQAFACSMRHTQCKSLEEEQAEETANKHR